MIKRRSLQVRVLSASGIVLFAFFILTGFALEQAIKNSLETAAHKRLQVYLNAMISAAEMNESGLLNFPDLLPETRLHTPGSGLYAQINAHDSQRVWRSPSLLGVSLELYNRLNPGQSIYQTTKSTDGYPHYIYSYGVLWETDTQERHYTFTIAEDKASVLAELTRFRQSLWGWLIAIWLVMVVTLLWVTRWSIRPLQELARDVLNLEQNEESTLSGNYPSELSGLVENLNHFIEHERLQGNRYRNSMADLAHSLKTPLAAMLSVLESSKIEKHRGTLLTQTKRIQQIVDYQLKKASLMGGSVIARSLSVSPVVERILEVLKKVYKSKNVRVCTRIEATARFYGHEDDLMECLGNILDNAFKFCEEQVRFTVEICNANDKNSFLKMTTENDGDTIHSFNADRALERGKRLDTQVEGQGLGLAIVKEITEAYNGQLLIETSSLGGAKVILMFPLFVKRAK